MAYLNKLQEKFVSCPYNPSHRVTETRLQYHIVKCMKNYPNHVICPFNALHRMEKKLYENHLSTCPDRNLMLPDIYKEMLVTQHGDLSETPIFVGNPQWNTEDENWGEE